jgi:hypothetical protein
MKQWTDHERREFNEFRGAGREHVDPDVVAIRVGDRVATPGGTGFAVEERLGGFLVKLEAAPPSDDTSPGPVAAAPALDEVFYLPLNLLRKLDV